MLETQIDERLWRSVKKNYEGRNYSESILDSVYFLSNLLRDKTGLESDGVALVGQALGGNQPQIKINSLQTESELNVQKGIEQILRGIYQAIRNPRSHDRYQDSQQDADAIIIFIDYISRVIDQSKTQFSETEFYSRVFDTNFVENERYAELIINEIPKGKRFNFAIEVYKKKETGDGKKLKYFFKSAINDFSEEERIQFIDIVSVELLSTSKEKTLRYILQILPFEYWLEIKEISRIRIENMLMDSIREGNYLVDADATNGGALGSWLAWGQIKYMTFIKDFVNVLLKKLDNGSDTEIDYVIQFFWDDLLSNITHPNLYFNRVIKGKLKAGDVRIYNKLEEHFIFCAEDDIILSIFNAEYKNFKEKKRESQPVDISDDDLPF